MRCDPAPAGDRCGRRARSMSRCGSGRACGCGSARGCSRAHIRRHRGARPDRPSETIRRGCGQKQNVRRAARRTTARAHPRPRPMPAGRLSPVRCCRRRRLLAAAWPAAAWRVVRRLVVNLAQDHVDLAGNSSRPRLETFLCDPCRVARSVVMMRSRDQPAARMAATARNSITLRSAPAGAPSRISSATSSDRPSRSASSPGRRRLLCAGTLGHQHADHRRDVAERPVLQHVAGHGDEAIGAAAVDLDMLAVRSLRHVEMLAAEPSARPTTRRPAALGVISA